MTEARITLLRAKGTVPWAARLVGHGEVPGWESVPGWAGVRA